MRILDLFERTQPIDVRSQTQEFMETVFWDQIEDLEQVKTRSELIRRLNTRSQAEPFRVRFEVQQDPEFRKRATTDENGEIIVYVTQKFFDSITDPDTQEEFLADIESLVQHELVHREQVARSQGHAAIKAPKFKRIADAEAKKLANPHEIRAYAEQIVAELGARGLSATEIQQAVKSNPRDLNRSPNWNLYYQTFGKHDPYQVLNRLRKTIIDIVQSS